MRSSVIRLALLLAFLPLGACGPADEPRIDASSLESMQESFATMSEHLTPEEYQRLKDDVQLIAYEAMGGADAVTRASLEGRMLNEAAMHERTGRALHGKSALDIFREAAAIRAAQREAQKGR